MTDRTLPAKGISAGNLLSIETGEYSDYSISGFFVALTDFDPREQAEAYLTEFPEQRAEYHADHSAFLAWMIRRGLLLEIDYTPVHIGSYGSLEIS